MRKLLVAALFVAVLSAPQIAGACIRAGEANQLLGWTPDGAYSLLALVDDKGALDHAEILPTTYQGFVYVIAADEDRGIVVGRAKVGQCASFGDDDKSVVERAKGKLTEASLRKLKTVAQLKFSRDERPESKKTHTESAGFTGAKRYDVHDLRIGDADMPLPVWCVGSCLADENWKKWTVTLVATHWLQSGPVLYEVTLANVCNGGTLTRLVQLNPAGIKVPEHRCTGSGE